VTTSDRWLQIKELFRLYEVQPPASRERWLLEQCGDDRELLLEVRDLLAAKDDGSDVLDDGAIGLLRRMSSDVPASGLVGRRFGAYRLVKLLGEGGMGSVYLAEREQEDFAQRVAFKLIRGDFVDPGMRERFMRERNILARLSHPHIAQLHDGGIADGVPFFTLEYVEGEAITRYCDDRNVGLRARIELVLQVCAAVAYAHRNLVVHRDLKPSNILVTGEGEVKLLDFGIAKLLNSDSGAGTTATQARLMTPEYAAPEQVLGGQITTATDVYAIGVLLYELLSGRLPYARADAGTLSWPQAVVEEAPEPIARALHRTSGRGSTITGDVLAARRSTTLPSLQRYLRGDLDRIAQRALAKEPEVRYASVADLADDLRAFIEGRAISGSGRRYRMKMFLRRHWLPLGAAAAILGVLIAGGAAIVWQSRQIAREAQNTLQVKNFLFGLFTAVDPRAAKGREVSARELLDRGAERIERNPVLDPVQRAEIESTLGRIYYQLGLYDQADKLQSSAIAALAAMPAQALRHARTQTDRAETLSGRGEPKQAAELAEQASSTLETLSAATDEDRARTLHVRGRIALDQRDFAKAQTLSEQEIMLARKADDADATLLFGALMTSGAASWGLAQPGRAEATWREAAQIAARNGQDVDLAKARANIGMALQRQSRYSAAVEVERQALAGYEKALGAEHDLTMSVRADLALSDYQLGLYAPARATMEQVIADERRKFGDSHPAIAGTEINLGLVLIDSGEPAAAEPVLTESIAIFEKKFGRDHEGVRLALGALALAHTALGQLDRAENELDEVIAQANKPGSKESGSFVDRYRLGEVKRLKHELDAAIELQRAALTDSVKEYGENSRYTAVAHQYLGLSLRDRGDDAGAIGEFQAALASFASYLPNAEHPLAATARYELGQLLLKHDPTRQEGLRMLAEAADLREKFLGADNVLTQQARATLRLAQGRVK